MKDSVHLTMGDWQWNAALVGFINIVGTSKVKFVGNDTIEFSPTVLDGFENKFFDYLIKTYEETLSWYKIVAFKDVCKKYVEDDFTTFDLEAVKRLNAYVEYVKPKLKSNSYVAAYDLIQDKVDMLALEKKLTKIKVPKNTEIFCEKKPDIMDEAKKIINILEQVIDYCENANGKKYIAAKNIIYTIVKNAWNGISFFNMQYSQAGRHKFS